MCLNCLSSKQQPPKSSILKPRPSYARTQQGLRSLAASRRGGLEKKSYSQESACFTLAPKQSMFVGRLRPSMQMGFRAWLSSGRHGRTIFTKQVGKKCTHTYHAKQRINTQPAQKHRQRHTRTCVYIACTSNEKIYVYVHRYIYIYVFTHTQTETDRAGA